MRKFVLVALLSLPVSALADEALLKKYSCTACHQTQAKVVGPSYKMVADKYRDRADAQSYVAGKIRAGGKGVWGQIAMPAQAQVSEADAQVMAKYILSVR